MKFKKGQSGNPKGRKKGAKSKLSESFYQDCLAAYNDPRVGGLEGLVRWIIESKRNRMAFYAWMAKTIPANLQLGDESGGPIAITLTKTVTVIKPKDYASE